jgi:hypothetical protein
VAAIIPNVGEEACLKFILGRTLYLGLFTNSAAGIASLGEAIKWSDITPATGFVGGNEKTLASGSWTIPTGVNAGNPATYPQQTFTADVGGASSVAGYYVRTVDNELLLVELHPEVESSGTLKAMPEGAVFRVNAQLGAA